MQTFLPLPSFVESAKCLDMKRLGKQRVEVLQILNAIHHNKGWVNHPATKMWKGNVNALVNYGLAICDEWKSRGYKDTCYDKIKSFRNEQNHNDNPKWLDDPRFCVSHRSNLLRKNPQWYGKFNWTEPNDIPYYWPADNN